ncbi:hypothetical protein [Actinoplanes sp. HUAS TT8]|uniref:hypothetical protein n=1 Tax=Actinoplanes sp. HUAS TT8 TaxID=3447453 RepID=UPI003F527D2B
MRVISRRVDGGIEVFDADLESSRVFPVPPEAEEWAVTSTRDGLVYATEQAVIRIGADGWHFDLGPHGEDAGNARTGLAFSADDSLVWVYAPNDMAGRAGGDQWIALDAATGEPRLRHSLPAVGHGGEHFALRDGRMLLDVGEGQDGSQIYLGTPDGDLRDFGWGNRVLIDVAPDESRFMTVDHDQDDVAVHDFPSGEVRFRITTADFAIADEFGDAFVEWSGGFLDGDTAIAVVTGENEETEEEWWRHFTVDLRAGRLTGEMSVTTIDPYDLRPLGDGTYVVTDTDGTLRRM